MSDIRIFRKIPKVKKTNAIINFEIENDLDPKDKATIRDLRAKLEKASDEMDDHEGAPKYEAAFKAAQKAYDDFLDKVKSANRTNAKDQEIDALRKENASLKVELKQWKESSGQ